MKGNTCGLSVEVSELKYYVTLLEKIELEQVIFTLRLKKKVCKVNISLET